MIQKKVAILQSNYIPWKGYFDAINSVDEFVIYDDMQYTKRDWRNRNLIKTIQGPQWLSIPVQVKGKFHQKINQTLVSERNWGEKHWRTIEQSYSKAAHFDELRDTFRAIYLENKEEYLSRINFAFIERICQILRIKTRFRWSSEFELKEEKTERLQHICRTLGATEYYSGPAARAYLKEAMFNDSGIQVRYFDYGGYPPYRQLYGDFVHEVTILDLLFNEGPDASRFMKSFIPA